MTIQPPLHGFNDLLIFIIYFISVISKLTEGHVAGKFSNHLPLNNIFDEGKST